MSNKNNTNIAFASEDIKYYRMVEGWRDNDKIGKLSFVWAR